MALNVKRVALLAKLQPGAVDAVPDGGANAILAGNMKVNQVADTVEREVVRPFFGNNQQVPVGSHLKLEFEVELAASGTAGTAPAWGVLLQGCGFAQTVTAAQKVEYTPVSAGQQQLSIYYNLDGVNFKLLSAKGSASLEFANKALPKLKFSFLGLHGGIADAAAPAVTLTAFKQPLQFTCDHVASFSVLGYAAQVENLSLDIANQLQYVTRPPSTERIEITERKPTGSVVIEMPTIAQKDFFVAARNAATGSLALVHGKTAGSIVEIAANVGVGTPDIGESNGEATLSLPLTLLPITGNDEFKLIVR